MMTARCACLLMNVSLCCAAPAVSISFTTPWAARLQCPSSFTGWSGACTGTAACVVPMTAAKAVTATFATTSVTYALTVTKSGTGMRHESTIASRHCRAPSAGGSRSTGSAAQGAWRLYAQVDGTGRSSAPGGGDANDASLVSTAGLRFDRDVDADTQLTAQAHSIAKQITICCCCR